MPKIDPPACSTTPCAQHVVERSSTFIATAECPPRDRIVVEARVPSHSDKHFAESDRQADLAAAAEAKEAEAHLLHESEKPSEHFREALTGLGDLVMGNLKASCAKAAESAHDRKAEKEEQRAREEIDAALEKARARARAQAEMTAATVDNNAPLMTAVVESDAHFTATAEMEGRPPVLGLATVTTHAEQHLARAARERELALDAGVARGRAEERVAAADPRGEAASTFRSLGNLIRYRYREAKAWFKARFRRRKSDAEAATGLRELDRELATARARAQSLAEDEATARDTGAVPKALSEVVTERHCGREAAAVFPIEGTPIQSAAAAAASHGAEVTGRYGVAGRTDAAAQLCRGSERISLLANVPSAEAAEPHDAHAAERAANMLSDGALLVGTDATRGRVNTGGAEAVIARDTVQQYGERKATSSAA